ncbi:molybdenum cofactor biosynthesis protein MoaD [Variovorax paradoxus]|jgi:molybdopterin synthase sulfur carrier subunit|uniref:MoaD/ThiS family protein n=1 Tax=Variovorax TaxID=34072 RepID=UPI0006E5A49B|nr:MULTISPECIES: MoaD/ThiS family protein [unclassified Variovorax]KPU89043.1 molybdenum cofactor biosynthesis protein MoaD [Variovorax paradoxus]KAF1072900.1 MAG: Molybdopterin synthase sulfur carrier subunit [Variovorax sp.]KPU90087.1 molybdenum cofactor biosynthesis protein MoaD [Variovorax paradoxus]KPV01316.1 molybdenum cofactor biosynthesis protein MoaD [Variovorax paradoxus]KPV19669.1 molybdenum cofactor biosynthesis protein MoaD [Variovorax paradoxus]
MKVHLRYFASVREALGKSDETIDTAAPTLAALRDELIARGGAYATVLARGRALRMALDHTMSDEAAAPHEGCEVAFFPPVTGG